MKTISISESKRITIYTLGNTQVAALEEKNQRGTWKRIFRQSYVKDIRVNVERSFIYACYDREHLGAIEALRTFETIAKPEPKSSTRAEIMNRSTSPFL